MVTRLQPRTCTAPVTALAHLAPSNYILAASASSLIATNLDSPTSSPLQPQHWTVLARERVHRIVVLPSIEQPRTAWHVLAAGGKEVALARIVVGEDHRLELEVLYRFALSDWVLDCAFVGMSSYLFLTAHNTVLHFTASTFGPPHLQRTINASLRPLLWSANFSRKHYDSAQDAEMVAGSMLGDILSWRLTNSDLAVDGELTLPLDRVRRRTEHRGGVFCLAHSPSGRYLASGSDDRTIRIWDLSLPDSADGEAAPAVMTMWGHEGRIWRLQWIDEGTLTSVAEDANCIVWVLDLAQKETPTYSILKTFSHGHDGRSIWSLTSCSLSESATVILTGGADGGVRSWMVPSRDTVVNGLNVRNQGNFLQLEGVGKIRGYMVGSTPVSATPNVLLLSYDGSMFLSPLSSSPTSATHLHASSHFCAPTLLQLSSRGPLAWAFSNRGYVARADLVSGISKEWETGVCAVKMAFDEEERRVAVFERKAARVVVFDATLSDELPTISSIALIDSTDPVTALRFLSNSDLLLLGLVSGALLLYSTSSSTGELLARSQLHEDGITDVREQSLAERVDEWGVETVGRDGVRGSHAVRKTGDVKWAIEKRGSWVVTRGVLERILSDDRYLALVDTSALVFDRQGNKLLSFTSPGNQNPNNVFFEDQLDGGAAHYFRLLSGRIHHQASPRSSSAASGITRPVVLPGIHGREIRCVALAKLPVSSVSSPAQTSTLVAMGAENAALSISTLDSHGSLAPVFADSTLLGAVKSVCWLSSPSTSSQLLFASGAREMLRAWRVSSSFSEAQSAGVQVLELGKYEEEAGEVRVMDMAVLPLVGVDLQADEKVVVIGGYSDGKLRIWFFSPTAGFVLVASASEFGKCILTVKVVTTSCSSTILFVGRSDGSLTVWDLTELLGSLPVIARDAVLPLPEPVLSFNPHQSGINALDTLYEADTNVVTVITGGDDNAVSLHRLHLSDASNDYRIDDQAFTLPSAHASTIQGINFLSPSEFVSSSVDQRLNVYAWSPADGGKLALVDSCCLGVADCSAMDVMQVEEGGNRVVLVGIGTEVVDVL